MKLFQRKISKGFISTAIPGRSPVFRGLVKDKKTLSRKRIIMIRRLGKLTRVFRILVAVIFVCFFTSIVVWVIINIVNRNTPLISPMAIRVFVDGDDIGKKFKDELNRSGIVFTDVKQEDGSSYIIKLSDKTEVFVTGAKDIPSQIASLQFIHNRLTMEGRLIRRLDLRYEKPVITFQ